MISKKYKLRKMKLSPSEQLNKQSEVIKKLQKCGSLDESLITFGVSKHYHRKWYKNNIDYKNKIDEIFEIWELKYEKLKLQYEAKLQAKLQAKDVKNFIDDKHNKEYAYLHNLEERNDKTNAIYELCSLNQSWSNIYRSYQKDWKRKFHYQNFLESLNFSEQLEIYKNEDDFYKNVDGVLKKGKNYSSIFRKCYSPIYFKEKWDSLFEDKLFWKWLINQDVSFHLRDGDISFKPFKENQTSFGEEISRFIFESIFSKSFPSQSPFFLGWKEIDGLNTELNLGFEHQGPFHDANHKFYRKGQKESDEYKKELSKSYGITIIQIPCIKKTKKSVLDAFYYILNEMERLNIHYPLLDLTTNQYYNKMYEIEDKLKTLDLGKMKNLPTRLLDCYNFNYLNILSFDEKQNISINYSNFESLLERTKKYRFCYGSELMNEIIQRERFLDLHSSKIIKVA